MSDKLLKLLERVGDFLARLPGLPVLVAIGLVILGLVVQLLPDWPVIGWLAGNHLLLYVGVILGFLGMLLGDVL